MAGRNYSLLKTEINCGERRRKLRNKDHYDFIRRQSTCASTIMLKESETDNVILNKKAKQGNVQVHTQTHRLT